MPSIPSKIMGKKPISVQRFSFYGSEVWELNTFHPQILEAPRNDGLSSSGNYIQTMGH